MNCFARLALAGALALGLAAPLTASAQQDKNVLVWGDQLPAGLDPHAIFDVPMQFILLNAYDTLYRYVGNPPELQPWLATDHTVSDDGLTWTFKLVPNAKFHDGSPLTSADVVYSFQRLLGMKRGPSGAFLPVLKPDKVTAPDPHTVKFVLDKPYAPFLAAIPLVAIVSEKQVKEHVKDNDFGTAWLSANDAGSGAYSLDPATYRPREALDLKRNQGPFQGLVGQCQADRPREVAPGGRDLDARAGIDAGRDRFHRFATCRPTRSNGWRRTPAPAWRATS